MFTKKYVGPVDCASCEKGIVNLCSKQAEKVHWNKLPFREPGERIARVSALIGNRCVCLVRQGLQSVFAGGRAVRCDAPHYAGPQPEHRWSLWLRQRDWRAGAAEAELPQDLPHVHEPPAEERAHEPTLGRLVRELYERALGQPVPEQHELVHGRAERGKEQGLEHQRQPPERGREDAHVPGPAESARRAPAQQKDDKYNRLNGAGPQ